MASAAERVLVARGYEIAYHDLYLEHFDPVQPTGEDANVSSSNVLVEQHCSELARSASWKCGLARERLDGSIWPLAPSPW
jgi:hypothetical protein